jgi:hypothetical protein
MRAGVPPSRQASGETSRRAKPGIVGIRSVECPVRPKPLAQRGDGNAIMPESPPGPELCRHRDIQTRPLSAKSGHKHHTAT